MQVGKSVSGGIRFPLEYIQEAGSVHETSGHVCPQERWVRCRSIQPHALQGYPFRKAVQRTRKKNWDKNYIERAFESGTGTSWQKAGLATASSCFLECELWFLKLLTIDICNDQLQFTQKLKIPIKRSLTLVLFPCVYNVGFKPISDLLLFLTFHCFLQRNHFSLSVAFFGTIIEG